SSCENPPYLPLRTVRLCESFFPLPACLRGRVRDELEGDRVEAVALARGGWAVVEDVAQVGVAALTADLHADHAVALVEQLGDVLRIERRIEARPAGA